MSDDNLPPVPPSSDPPPPPPPAPPAPPAAPPAEPPTAPPAAPPTTGGGGGGGGDIDIGGWLSESWKVVTENAVILVAGFLVIAIALSLSSIVVVGPFILAGPFLVAFTKVSKRCLDGQSPEFGELFSGFEDFARTCIAGLLFMGVIVAKVIIDMVLNFVLAYIPCLGSILGIVISLGLQIAILALTLVFIPIVAFRDDVQPVDALTTSVQFAMDNLQPVGLLAAVLFGLNLVGMLACGIGVLITAPMAFIVQVIAYERYYLPRA